MSIYPHLLNLSQKTESYACLNSELARFTNSIFKALLKTPKTK